MTEDETLQAAKDDFARAVTTLQSVLAPGEYVSGWVLITHRMSIELEHENATVVGCLVPTGQSFVETRGLLLTALDTERFGGGNA